MDPVGHREDMIKLVRQAIMERLDIVNGSFAQSRWSKSSVRVPPKHQAYVTVMPHVWLDYDEALQFQDDGGPTSDGIQDVENYEIGEVEDADGDAQPSYSDDASFRQALEGNDHAEAVDEAILDVNLTSADLPTHRYPTLSQRPDLPQAQADWLKVLDEDLKLMRSHPEERLFRTASAILSIIYHDREATVDVPRFDEALHISNLRAIGVSGQGLITSGWSC